MFGALQREDDWTTTFGGEAAFSGCGSVSIGELKGTALVHLRKHRLPLEERFWGIVGPGPYPFGRRIDDLQDLKVPTAIEINILAKIVLIGRMWDRPDTNLKAPRNPS